MLKIGDRVMYTPLNTINEEYIATIIDTGRIGLFTIQFDDMPYPQGNKIMHIIFEKSLTKIII